MSRSEYQTLKLQKLIFQAPLSLKVYTFFAYRIKIDAPLKKHTSLCNISIHEILNPLTFLCLYTGRQASHSGLANSELPSRVV
jgi:hypothetical protein